MKKDNDGMFDVTMGSFDGTEVCELVRLFILNDLANKYGTNNIAKGRRTRHFQEHNRTSSRKNTERNNKALARTQTEKNNPKQLKISRLLRYHAQLDERSLPTIQKTERQGALHQLKI